MKNKLFLLFSLLGLGCTTSQKHSTTKNITILAATSQKWHAGHISGSSGINYTIKAVAKKNNVWIDSLFLPKYALKVTVFKNNKEVTSVSKGDTLIIKAASNKNTPITEKKSGNGTLIKTRIKDKSSYISVSPFETLKEIYHP